MDGEGVRSEEDINTELEVIVKRRRRILYREGRTDSAVRLLNSHRRALKRPYCSNCVVSVWENRKQHCRSNSFSEEEDGSAATHCVIVIVSETGCGQQQKRNSEQR